MKKDTTKKIHPEVHKHMAEIGAVGGKNGSIEAKRIAGKLGASARWGKTLDKPLAKD